MGTSYILVVALRASFIMLSQEHLTKHEVTSVFSTATPPKCLKGIRCRRAEPKGAWSLSHTVQWKLTLSDVIHVKRRQCRDTCVSQIVLDSRTRELQTGSGDGKWSHRITQECTEHLSRDRRSFSCTNTLQSHIFKTHNFLAKEC